jgi:hypothetical protein
MDEVSRILRDEEEDHETRGDVPARFGELVVAYFVSAIESLSQLPKGPELAVRRVWSDQPAQVTVRPMSEPDRLVH